MKASPGVVRVYSVAGPAQPPLVNPIRPHVEPVSELLMDTIDVRCPALAPGRPAKARRCQLFAGHEGEHAVMYCRRGHRTVLMWARDSSGAVREHAAGQEALPWVPGMPSPAWSEEG